MATKRKPTTEAIASESLLATEITAILAESTVPQEPTPVETIFSDSPIPEKAMAGIVNAIEHGKTLIWVQTQEQVVFLKAFLSARFKDLRAQGIQEIPFVKVRTR